MSTFNQDFYRGFDAIIFDMDGILIDSEPLWWRAEIEVLQKVGVPLTEEMCLETMGTRVDEMVSYWFHRFPWQGPGIEDTANEVVECVSHLVATEGKAMPGAVELVGQLEELDCILAVASSSPGNLIDVVLKTIGLENSFKALFTAANEEAGKPDPAVYLTAASELKANRNNCLVFEDSAAGIRAGKGAGMTVVAVSPLGRGVDIGDADFRVDSMFDCLPNSAN